MGAVDGAGGKGKSAEPAKQKGKAGAFPPPKPAAASAAKPAAAPPAKPTKGTPAKGTAGFQLAKQEPMRSAEGAAPAMRPEVAQFAQGMVQAADAAAMPGPTTDSDLLPRESVSGMFVRDFALQGAAALGRHPLGEDEAARIVIEKHIAGTPGVYYDAKIEAEGADAFIVKLHRLDTNPPFLPDPKAEAAYKINRKTWQVERA